MPGLICPRCERHGAPGADICAHCRPWDRTVHLVTEAEFRATPEGGRYLLGLVLDGRYRVEGFVGGGGMAAVYRARQLSVDRGVALKVIRPGVIADRGADARFRQEARVVARLNHPNIVQLYDFGRDLLDPEAKSNPLFFMAMELVSGESLAARVERDGCLPLGPALRIARQVVSALAFAHEHGVVHRDLKPDNILLTRRSGEGDHARLLDFGIAKILSGISEDVTRTGAMVGTPPYMAPEQWKTEPVDARTDIYAFGCLLHEMLCGHPPFRGTTPVVVGTKHMLEPAPPIRPPDGSVVPPEVCAVVERCLAKAPEERFQTARALMAKLGDETGVATGRLLVAAPDPMSSRPLTAERAGDLKPRWRRALPASLMAVVGLAGVAWLLGHGDERSAPRVPVRRAVAVPTATAPPVVDAAPRPSDAGVAIDAEVDAAVDAAPPPPVPPPRRRAGRPQPQPPDRPTLQVEEL